MAKYLKRDSKLGYIMDNAEIEYAQFNNMRRSILGCMMGDFDSRGRYIISPQIVSELIKMPKYIVNSMDNMEICASVIKLDKQLTFLITYENHRATLSLLEKVNFEANIKLNCGTYSNINEYLLDEVETSGVVNKNAIYSMWNVQEFGGAALDVFNMDAQTIAAYTNLVNRFKYLMVANKIMLEKEPELEQIEATYANRILDILKAYPKLKEKVEKEIKTTLEEKKDFIKIDKPNFAKTFNEILEKAIENNISVLDEKEKESFETEKHNAQMETNILRRDVVDITPTIVEIPKEVEEEISVEEQADKKQSNEEQIEIVPAFEGEVVAPSKKGETIAVILDDKGESKKPLEEIVEELSNARRDAATEKEQSAVDVILAGKAQQEQEISTTEPPKKKSPKKENDLEKLISSLTGDKLMNPRDHISENTKKGVKEAEKQTQEREKEATSTPTEKPKAPSTTIKPPQKQKEAAADAGRTASGGGGGKGLGGGGSARDGSSSGGNSRDSSTKGETGAKWEKNRPNSTDDALDDRDRSRWYGSGSRTGGREEGQGQQQGSRTDDYQAGPRIKAEAGVRVQVGAGIVVEAQQKQNGQGDYVKVGTEIPAAAQAGNTQPKAVSHRLQVKVLQPGNQNQERETGDSLSRGS